MSETTWVIASIGLGLVVGSFLNVLIHRLPRMMDGAEGEDLDDASMDHMVDRIPPTALSLVAPGSHCPGCGHRIRAIENLPLVSYCFLRGRCAGCGQPISWRYPIIELLGAAGALACVLVFGPTPQAAAAMIFTWFAIAVAFIDFDHLMIPDVLSISLVWLGLIFNVFGTFAEPGDAIVGAVSGYLVFRAINAIAARILGREAIGQGDFKLFAAIGAWLGWQALAPALLIASATGAAIGYALVWTGKTRGGEPICFAPFLMFGALAVMLFDGRLVLWLGGLGGLGGLLAL
jgi:leader peptidase (prepilin peptidase) / N-methyltransferase